MRLIKRRFWWLKFKFYARFGIPPELDKGLKIAELLEKFVICMNTFLSNP